MTHLSSGSARRFGRLLLLGDAGALADLLGGSRGFGLATGTSGLGALDGRPSLDGVENPGAGVAGLGACAFANHGEGYMWRWWGCRQGETGGSEYVSEYC